MQTEKTVEQLQADLEKMRKALKNPNMNSGLLASMKKRIAGVEAELKAKGVEVKAAAPAAKKEAPTKKAAPVKKEVSKPAKKTTPEKRESKDDSVRSKKELMENSRVKSVLAKDYVRHRVHFELSKVGLSKKEISVVTGATTSNIGRDLLFYKKGKLKAD